jgi:hypothetical protein
VAFTFEITQVDKLAGIGIGVLDGKMVDGHVNIGSKADLVHGGQRFPLRVNGVALFGRSHGQPGLTTLSVDLRQPAMEVAEKGDLLICEESSEPVRAPLRKLNRRRRY